MDICGPGDSRDHLCWLSLTADEESEAHTTDWVYLPSHSYGSQSPDWNPLSLTLSLPPLL